MAVRTEDDEGNVKRVIPYIIVETIFEDSICLEVILPPRQVSADTCKHTQ